jgi:hypothetical protein
VIQRLCGRPNSCHSSAHSVLGFPFRIVAIPLLLALYLLSLLPARAQSPELDPREFKAVILAKLPPYIEWPKHAFAHSEDKIILGLLGIDPFDGLLADLIKGTRAAGREIEVRTLEPAATVEELRHCHILFIPAPFESLWFSLRERLQESRAILTVGETDDFIPAGGLVNISIRERKLQIHLRNSRKAGLEINSKLLRISDIVK